MFEALGSRENIPLLVALAVVVTVALAFMAPAEATLGQAAKLVYVHAALMWVAFGVLTWGGLAAAGFLVARRQRLLGWSAGLIGAGITLFVMTGLLGMATAVITWGGVFWGEPRLKMLFGLLIVGGLTLIVGRLGNDSARSAANIFFSAVAWFLLFRTERVIHPVSPIFSSDSLAIKIFPLLITASLAFAALQLVRYWANPVTGVEKDA